jgi:hypothetical protein
VSKRPQLVSLHDMPDHSQRTDSEHIDVTILPKPMGRWSSWFAIGQVLIGGTLAYMAGPASSTGVLVPATLITAALLLAAVASHQAKLVLSPDSLQIHAVWERKTRTGDQIEALVVVRERPSVNLGTGYTRFPRLQVAGSDNELPAPRARWLLGSPTSGARRTWRIGRDATHSPRRGHGGMTPTHPSAGRSLSGPALQRRPPQTLGHPTISIVAYTSGRPPTMDGVTNTPQWTVETRHNHVLAIKQNPTRHPLGRLHEGHRPVISLGCSTAPADQAMSSDTQTTIVT